ncbi:hypothetical protein [Roseibacillus ishigakijimensis]|uniref:Uncharacterized protein n=1 Tax=Roseibacillus ishigakijimensis TaxID=454146 RepID=A0A934RRJ3_9BACT|nr:hypothetical protein [Roseibacillus ishigakijimensis]MBK1834326.1 hypothetical protein [Roseibacillus ishigakijimensis]
MKEIITSLLIMLGLMTSALGLDVNSCAESQCVLPFIKHLLCEDSDHHDHGNCDHDPHSHPAEEPGPGEEEPCPVGCDAGSSHCHALHFGLLALPPLDCPLSLPPLNGGPPHERALTPPESPLSSLEQPPRA